MKGQLFPTCACSLYRLAYRLFVCSGWNLSRQVVVVVAIAASLALWLFSACYLEVLFRAKLGQSRLSRAAAAAKCIDVMDERQGADRALR